MGTVLFQKRHYEYIADKLNHIKAPDYIIEYFCRELYRDNKYFKPKVFLTRAGMPEGRTKEIVDRLPYINNINTNI